MTLKSWGKEEKRLELVKCKSLEDGPQNFEIQTSGKECGSGGVTVYEFKEVFHGAITSTFE